MKREQISTKFFSKELVMEEVMREGKPVKFIRGIAP